MALGMCLLAAVSAHAQLLSYDGFGSGYTAGNATGQAYQGTGYAAGGVWNNNSFADGGLTHSTLVTTPGVKVVRGAGDMIGDLNRTVGGPFQTAGLIGSNGNIGGAGVTGTVYYSFLGREIDGNGNGWAGFNLWQTTPDREQFGIGNPGGPDYYGIYHNDSGGEPAITNPAVTIDGATHFFVGKVEYNAAGQDFHTAWLDPDPSLAEAAQPANIKNSAGSRPGPPSQHDDGFDVYRMRGDDAQGDWEFDEVRFGTTWESVTPVVPEPTLGFFGALGLTAFALLRRRPRR
jgi:MYXO-CTERM domain-containing protein